MHLFHIPQCIVLYDAQTNILTLIQSVTLKHGPISDEIACIIAVTGTEDDKWDFELTKDTPYACQCQKLGKIFSCLRYKLLLNFATIWDVNRYLNPNKTTLTKYCLTQWISKLHWVRQYLVNIMGLMDIVNATVYKTEPNFTGLGLGHLS